MICDITKSIMGSTAQEETPYTVHSGIYDAGEGLGIILRIMTRHQGHTSFGTLDVEVRCGLESSRPRL